MHNYALEVSKKKTLRQFRLKTNIIYDSKMTVIASNFIFLCL